MFVVVLSSVFLGFVPLTAVMIVIMSLLDDVPIMTIAYDNTPVSEKPIRWRMPYLLGVATVLGLFCVAESFGLLLIKVVQRSLLNFKDSRKSSPPRAAA